MSHLVVFDLDGTLIDSRLDLAESANEMLSSYGAEELPVDTVASFIGEGARNLVLQTLTAAGLTVDVSTALDRFLDVYSRRLLVHTRPYPAMEETLAALTGRASIAVLTNKPEAPTRRLLDAFHLAPYFDWVLGGDSVFPRKPDPTGLRHLIREAGATGSTTMFVGDSMVDVETARRAGARMCVAMYGFGHIRQAIALEGDELVAEAPMDLVGLLDRFLAAD